ncbi:MAG: penicillin-binding protein family [Gemmatimonadetes bacterium]|nr:penicillin-binding protein family [Gemmatimonadota bacterium]
MKAGRGKKLGGAPRVGRWTRPRADKGKPRTAPGGLVLLLVLAGLLLAGTGVFLWRMNGELEGGLVAQDRIARRRPDWVRLGAMPGYVPAAFLAVVDTGGFRTQATREPAEGPMLARDLVRQVHRLGDGLADQTRATAMAPLLEEHLPPRDRLELYLNRIDLGKTGSWPVYGVFHAAREYFEKAPAQLTVGDAATLAGLLLPPRVTVPEAVPGVVGARRNEVLRRMLERGAIDEAAYRGAMAEPLAFQPGIEYAPMSRPADWRMPPAVIRVPLALPAADSASGGQSPSAPSPSAPSPSAPSPGA